VLTDICSSLSFPIFSSRLDTYTDPRIRTSLPPADAQLAFKEFLRGATGTLTASEIARVRDQAGVTDLGGF
jgi:hypothetical protein